MAGYRLPSAIARRGAVLAVALAPMLVAGLARPSAAFGPDADEELPNRPGEGVLDCVFCIDTTGSMWDDIAAVQEASQEILDQLTQHCQQSKISLQVGLVTYQDHSDAANYRGRPEAAWLRAWPMSPDSKQVRDNILAIRINAQGVGGDLPEDLYAALMCAMDSRPDWEGTPVTMGWRAGAAKIILVMTDAPPHDPDFEGRALENVADRAAELDPVHVYPLILPGSGPSFLDPSVRSLGRLAEATGGQVTSVRAAKDLPGALVGAVKLAIRRHREEVWRSKNPPYALFAAGGAILMTVVSALAAVILVQLRRQRVQAAAPQARPDPRLTGQTALKPWKH